MPSRRTPIILGQTYHVFNRGIDHRPTFTATKEYERAMVTLRHYKYADNPTRLSHYLRLDTYDRQLFEQRLQLLPEGVRIYAFCLMPNHYHLLIEPLIEDGISKFISLFQNSYTRYFNTRHQRVGPLFLTQFKAVKIVSTEQLLHTSRYIHLNPITSTLADGEDTLLQYPWSSLPEYLKLKLPSISSPDRINQSFSSTESYWDFVRNRIKSQQELHKLNHTLLKDAVASFS